MSASPLSPQLKVSEVVATFITRLHPAEGPSVRDQRTELAVKQHIVGYPAERPFAEAALAVGAGNDQLDTLRFCDLSELGPVASVLG